MKKYKPFEVLPHKSPMILVDDYQYADATSIEASLLIKKDAPFCVGDKIPAYICLEYMAQTIAMWRGILGKKNDEPPKIGYLVSCRKFVLYQDYFLVGEQLKIFGNLKCMIDQMASFDCKIEINNHIVATSAINVYQPEV